MSILIKGMAMPTSCGFCLFEKHTDDGYECRINGCLTEYQKRPSDCPLVPVPPHGRCIDAEAAKEFLKPVDSIRNYEPEWTWGELYESNCNAIDKLPTIIEAEEGNG